jgi:hypothetical protein
VIHFFNFLITCDDINLTYFLKGGWVQQPGAAVYIDASPDGTVWCINRTDEIYSWNGRDWEKKPGAARTVGVGSRYQDLNNVN